MKAAIAELKQIIGMSSTFTARVLVGVLTVCASLSSARPASADAVVHWNSVASSAIGTATAAGRPGPVTQLDFAMVHAAIHDAVQAIVQRYEPYHQQIPGASGSPAAATAKAAYDMLLHLFPAQSSSLDAAYASFFSANGLAFDDPGVLVGQQAAAGIINLRLNDGRFPPTFPPFIGATGAGDWRPTISYLPGPPPSGAPMAVPWLDTVAPFTLRDASQFRADPPPLLTGREYARDYNEVKALGGLTSGQRTAAHTDLAYFFTDNIFLQWNRTLRGIASGHITDIADTARLFALANIAAADAVITTWDSKKHYNLWRPMTAIQEGEADENPRTAGDPSWQPLGNNPNYPDYTSGVNIVTAAMTTSLRHFFGRDRLWFEMSTNAPAAVQKIRVYRRFTDVERDAVEARMYLGIHFRFANTAGRDQGRRVAHWVYRHYLRPLDGRPRP